MSKLCLNCGKEITQPRTGHRRKFCSADCRRTWWESHQDLVQRKPTAFYEGTCAYCGKTFVAYGNSHRKYCSHECYNRDRFWRKEEFTAALECLRTGKKITNPPLWLQELLKRDLVK